MAARLPFKPIGSAMLRDGGTAGGRVTHDMSHRFALELGDNFSINVRRKTPIAPGLSSYTFGNQIHKIALDGVYSLKSRSSRLALYLRMRRQKDLNTLDEQRAMNAGTVLVGGGSESAKLDRSQVKAYLGGADQTSTPEPGLCGTSNFPASEKERRGGTTTQADQEQRVKIYLVPKGGGIMPHGIQNAKQYTGEITGCEPPGSVRHHRAEWPAAIRAK